MVKAFFHPLNIAMLVVVVLAGLFAARWLAPLGLLLWLIMFFNQYRVVQNRENGSSS